MKHPIEPFLIEIKDEAITDLNQRLKNTRWPERETVTEWSQGVPLSYMQDMCDYWLTDYNWRKTEERLNEYPQFRTQLDGLNIHFFHIKSQHNEARPLIITHGWPGSPIEFLAIIDPLVNPTAHGGTAQDAFHLVIPSIPGYGFSEKPSQKSWGVQRIAEAWAQLMARLGYKSYFAQGGDWGSIITNYIAIIDSEHCIGAHMNMPFVLPDPETLGSLTAKEQSAIAAFKDYENFESGYSKQQATRPQTLGYALADSPIGQAAWIIEKFYNWSDCNGDLESIFSKEKLLDNVMMYWLNNTSASSGRLYWESFDSSKQLVLQQVSIPVGCSIFPKEIFRCSQRWAEKQFENLAYFNEPNKGGHFAAMEQPELFVNELRDCFRKIRKG